MQALSDPHMRPTRAWWVSESPSTPSCLTQVPPQHPSLCLCLGRSTPVLTTPYPDPAPTPSTKPMQLGRAALGSSRAKWFCGEWETTDITGLFSLVSCQSSGTALDAPTSTALSSLPDAARDSLGWPPGLAQERDKGVAAKALVQMEPLLGLENSTPAQNQFCLMPPPPEPRALPPQPTGLAGLNPEGSWEFSLLPFYK